MKIYEELVARGLIAQVTNEEEIGNIDVYKRQDQMMYRRKRLQKEAGGMKGRKGFE